MSALQSYVSCTVGIQYIGYCMITLGVANAVCSCLIGCAQRHVHREALVAIGCVLHAALIIFLLVWIPDRHLLAVFFVLSALWGLCEAIWQTQANGLSLLILPAYLSIYLNYMTTKSVVMSVYGKQVSKQSLFHKEKMHLY